MKYCWHCGKENQDAARYCRHCGAQFALAESAVATPTTPYPQASGFAIASLVLGILWLYWIGSILALVFGYLARGEMRRDPQRVGGRDMATAGIVLGWVGVAPSVAAGLPRHSPLLSQRLPPAMCRGRFSPLRLSPTDLTSAFVLNVGRISHLQSVPQSSF